MAAGLQGGSRRVFRTAENERATRVEADAAHLTVKNEHVNWLLFQQKRGTEGRELKDSDNAESV